MIKSLAVSQDYSPQEKKQLYIALEKNEYFVRVCFSHIAKDIPEFHGEIYADLDDESLTYYGAVVFRGAAKSTIKTFVSIKRAVQQTSPLTMYISETEDQAIDDLGSAAAELEDNEIIHWLYFNGKSAVGKQWGAKKIVLRNGCAIIAKGMDSRLRGKKTKMQRPTLIIFDDFVSKANSSTVEGRAAVDDTVSSVIIPMGDVGCKYWFFNTLPNSKCYMAVEVLNPDGIFRAPKGKLYKREITQVINGIEEPTWPSRYGWDFIEEKKNYYTRRGEMSKYLQEYCNMPEDEAEPVFEIDKITMEKAIFKKFGKITYLEFPDGRQMNIDIYNGFDPACKTKKRNDDTCRFTIGVDPHDIVWILDIFVGKVPAENHPEMILADHERFGAKKTTVETYGYQFSILGWVKKLMLARKRFHQIDGFEDKKAKSQKFIEGLCPMINAGRVKYIQGCSNIDIFLDQAKTFNGTERTHDDTLDGFFLAALPARKPWIINVEWALVLEDDKLKNKNKTKVYEANYMVD